MLAYGDRDSNGHYIPWHNEYTMQVLYRMGYRWPEISEDYVRQFTSGMMELGFFDTEDR